MRRLRLVACVATMLTFTVLFSGGARAQGTDGGESGGSVFGSTSPGEVDVDGTTAGTTTGGGSDSGGPDVGNEILVDCDDRYFPAKATNPSAASEVDDGCAGLAASCVEAAKEAPDLDLSVPHVRLRFGPDHQWHFYSTSCDRPAKPVVTVAAVRERAVRLIPSAAVGLAPKAATLVNIETVMWVAAPATRQLPQVLIVGQRVVISLKVDHVVYDFGDDTDDPHGPVGKAYDTAHDPCRTRDCVDYYGHVYTRIGTKTVTATVYWQASFTVNRGKAQQIPDLVPGPAASATVRVREARAVLVPNP